MLIYKSVLIDYVNYAVIIIIIIVIIVPGDEEKEFVPRIPACRKRRLKWGAGGGLGFPPP